MALELKNYDPAVMQGANLGVTVDLTDITDQNGNEVIEIDGTASAVNFLRVTNSATASAVTLSARGDDTNIGLTINSLLTGALTLDSTSTGAVDIGTSAFAKTITIGNTTGATLVAIKSGSGGTVVTSADGDALSVGANGATNPVLKVDASTSSVATGVSITGAATGTAVAIAAIGSAADESLTINAKGTGSVTLGNVSTGGVLIPTAVNYRRQVTDTGGAYATPVVLTAAQSGRVILVDDAAGLDFTLPAIGSTEIGVHFKFVVTVTITSNNFRVTAAAGDLLFGGLWMPDFDAAVDSLTREAIWLTPDGTDDLVMTCNGSTTGGKKGSWVEFIATSATQWFVHGVVAGDGTIATPFS